MHKRGWLTATGIACMLFVIILGLLLLNDSETKVVYITLGIILSLIVVGLGEILAHLQNGGKK